jgi:hypothetical protein
VWIILDPDGTADAVRMAQQIGTAARVVTIPAKVDDAILAGMTSTELQGYFRQARKTVLVGGNHE